MSKTECGAWFCVCRFKDGSTYMERGITVDNVPGIEERIFNADGTLRPLSNGRVSPADNEVLP